MTELDPERLKPLIVLGIAGRIGAGASFVRDKLQHGLRGFDYEVSIIDVTTFFLIAFFDRVSADADPLLRTIDVRVEEFQRGFSSEASRIRELQRRGNELRKRYGKDIIARLSVSENIWPYLQNGKGAARQHRVAFIVDSLKRPEEVDFLRSVFRDAFVMIGVVASDHSRRERLKQRKHLADVDFQELSEIDSDEQSNEFGQRVTKAILKSDYFFANDYATKDELLGDADRLLRIAFGIGIVSPTAEEVGMHAAFEAAARSACLSRQVGAAIFAQDGTILATGHNDVPQVGGGLYGAAPSRGDDKRCWAVSAKCYNDEEKQAIVDELTKVIGQVEGLKDKSDLLDQITAALDTSRIRSLIEFSRAVHAEADAIITIARTGRLGLVGATLYCTTFPCHNCAKHIIAAGIARVVYLEPYEKSLARKLHFDAIADPFRDDRSSVRKVRFDAYGGASPAKYEAFFKMKSERKKDGRFIDHDRRRAHTLPLGAVTEQECVDRIQRAANAAEKFIRRVGAS